MQNKIISVIGLGYVGLPTAILLASAGNQVYGYDTDIQRINIIKNRKLFIDEKDLNKIFQKVAGKKLLANDTLQTADIYVICVPTPLDNKTKSANMRHVEKAVEAICKLLKMGDLVVLESTSPVGTLKKIAKQVSLLRPDLLVPKTNDERGDIYLAYCPERILPGNSLHELVYNDRIIGGINSISSQKAALFYKIFVKANLEIATNSETAEMAKLTENAFRDVNIAFSNELSMLSDRVGVDVWELVRLANMHPRVNILNPGAGVGGHCIPLDPWFLIDQNPSLARLMTVARRVNVSKEDWIVKHIKKVIYSGVLSKNEKKIVTIYGLTYKENVNDIRESPSLSIIQKLASSDMELNVIDPNISVLPSCLLDLNVTLNKIVSPDVSVILVKHDQFKQLHFEGIVIDPVGLTYKK